MHKLGIYSVDALEKKMEDKETKENKDNKEILDAQTIIDDILVANSDAIKRIVKEIQLMVRNKTVTKESCETLEEVNEARDENKKVRNCKYFNKGHCKY
jgi:hypothetical protein